MLIADAKNTDELEVKCLAVFSLESTNQLLADLEVLVSFYEEAAVRRVENTQNIIYPFGGFILIILLLEVFIIFRPFEKMIQLSFDQIGTLAKQSGERTDRMRLAADSAGIGVWELDIVTKEVTWDDWMIRLYGFTPETFKSPRETMAKGIHPQDLEKCISQIKSAIKGNSKFDMEFRVFYPNGDLRYLKVSSKLVSDQGGHPLKLIGINYDITELLEKEKQVRLANQRMHLAADSAGIGIWDFDLKTNELIWDDWMIRLYGLKRENFKGAYQAWEEGVHPDDIERAAEELQAGIRGEKKFDTEFRVKHPSGEIRYIKADAIVLSNDAGEPVQMIGTNYDITDRVESVKLSEKANQRMQLAADSAGIGVWIST